MRALCAVVIATSGCELVFGLEDPMPVDAPAADAGPDADPMDRDGDLVPNDVDNCPDTHNPAQENEDLQGGGDACDICPFDGGVADSDMDGVGDLCDPHPSEFGDSIVFFDGFQADTGVWDRQPAGTWILLGTPGGVVEDVAINAEHRLNKLGVYTTTNDELYVQARFVVNEAGGASDGLAGVQLDFASDASGQRGTICGLRYGAGTTEVGALDPEDDMPISTIVNGNTTSSFVYRYSAIGILRFCSFGTGSMPTIQAGSHVWGSAHNGIVGLFVDDARIAVEWLVIYRFVPPPS